MKEYFLLLSNKIDIYIYIEVSLQLLSKPEQANIEIN